MSTQGLIRHLINNHWDEVRYADGEIDYKHFSWTILSTKSMEFLFEEHNDVHRPSLPQYRKTEHYHTWMK